MSERIERILKQIGAIEQSQGKHRKFLLPNHMTYVLPRTPGDWRSAENALSTLKRLLSGVYSKPGAG